MAQTTTNNCLGLFYGRWGPLITSRGVDDVGSSAIAIVVLVNNVNIIIKKHNKKTYLGLETQMRLEALLSSSLSSPPFSLPVLAVDGAIASLF
jgi:hypothetical protein